MITATSDRAVEFPVGGNRVTITAAELAKIRDAVADAVHASDRLDRDQLASELTTAACSIDDQNVPRIGRWLLENRDGRPVLVRHPPRAAVMHFVLVELRRDGGRWVAADISDERVTAR